MTAHRGIPQSARPHPVVFDVAYPERLSRLLIFVKWLLVIPQLIVVYLLLLVFGILAVIAWFAILFTGRYPKSFFDFSTGVLRWTANVFAYASLLRDEYPPFSLDSGAYALVLDIPRAERQSRLRLFIRWFAVLPNMLIFYFVQFAWLVTSFIAWWGILFSGRYPRGLFKFNVGVARWYFRQTAYVYLLRDEYPPYSVNANARPGNEVASAVIGLPLGVAYIGLQLLPFVSLFVGGGDREPVDAALLDDPQRLARERPAVSGGGLEITLVGFDGDTTVFLSGYDGTVDAIGFDIESRRSWYTPAVMVPWLFEVTDCYGTTYAVEDVEGSQGLFGWFSDSADSTLYFAVADGVPICELSYFNFGGSLTFEFE